jgi:flagellar basal body-associated protein FliL
MADKEEKKTKEEKPEKQDGGKIGILTWAIMAVVVAVMGGSGFVVGHLLANPTPKSEETILAEQAAEQLAEDEANEAKPNWYYNDMEPVIANLDVPGVTRYVRAAISIEISGELDKIEGEILLKEKAPLLKNWLAVYLAGLSLDETRGEKNLKRIQLRILDSFNEMLFPDSKSHLKTILFKEFAVQ